MNKTVPLPLQDLLSWVGRQSEMRPRVRGGNTGDIEEALVSPAREPDNPTTSWV